MTISVTSKKSVQNGFHTPQPSTKAWLSLSKLLPSRDPDSDYWWKMTGEDLSNMVDAAGYPIEKQYEALLFHHHWIVPYMGPAPRPGVGSSTEKFAWPCVLTLEGVPMEYSWKWNLSTHSSRPEIRYCIEAKHHLTGTPSDPLNQAATLELLRTLSETFPGIDLTWTNHFLSTLYSPDPSPSSEFTTLMLAIELKPSSLRLKTYFIPRIPSLPSPLPVSHFRNSIASLLPSSPSASTLFSFLSANPTGRRLTATMLAVDNVSPETSSPRLKLYLQSPSTSFASTREIMTLGGKARIPESAMGDLRGLIAAVGGVGEDFPEDGELPIAGEFGREIGEASNDRTLALPGMGYYFDLSRKEGSGGEEEVVPDVKVFVRLCVNGGSDAEITERLGGWMNGKGRGKWVEGYEGMVGRLGRGGKLAGRKGLHTHVAVMWKREEGEWEVTSYLGAETGGK